MKKTIALLVFVSVLGSLSAQKVNETVTMFGKEQLQGFTINISDATTSIVEGALNDKMQNQLGLKGSKKKGFYVYENQACSTFGDARYDIYFTTAEVGKKKDMNTQLTLVVSTGNMNCITFSNDPRTSRNIVAFLESLPQDVETYKIKLRINELEKQLAKLDKERQSMEKDQTAIQDKLNTGSDDFKRLSDQIDKKNDEIHSLQERYNKSFDPALKEEIDAAMKDKQSMQKTQTSMQKTLLNANQNLQKVKTKLETNQKAIEDTEKELKSLKEKLSSRQ